MNLRQEFSQILPRIKNVNIKMPFGSIYAGSRKSLKRGNSGEFSDYSSYSEGDDIRRLDWNCYARSGKLFIKNNYDERKAQLNIFADTSRSMAFGDKERYVRLAVCVLCYWAKNDSVAIYAGGKSYKQSGDFFGTLEFMDSIEFSGDKFEPSFSRGLNVVISDFLYDGIEKKFPRKPYCDVSLVQVADKRETEPLLSDFVTLCDMETQDRLNADAAVVSAYKREFAAHKKAIYEYSSRNGFRYGFVGSQEDPVKVLERI